MDELESEVKEIEETAVIKIPLEIEEFKGKGYFISRVVRWKGLHTEEYAKALSGVKDQGLTGIYSRFAISLILCEDFNLPGLSGSPKQWGKNFKEFDLQIMLWVIANVLNDYENLFRVKKKF